MCVCALAFLAQSPPADDNRRLLCFATPAFQRMFPFHVFGGSSFLVLAERTRPPNSQDTRRPRLRHALHGIIVAELDTQRLSCVGRHMWRAASAHAYAV